MSMDSPQRDTDEIEAVFYPDGSDIEVRVFSDGDVELVRDDLESIRLSDEELLYASRARSDTERRHEGDWPNTTEPS